MNDTTISIGFYTNLKMPRSGLRESPARTRYGVVIEADFPECQICKKTFSNKRSRKRHLVNVHGVTEDHVEADRDEDLSWCEICSSYHGSFEDHSPVRSSSALSYISVAQSVTGEEVGCMTEEAEIDDLDTAKIEIIEEEVNEDVSGKLSVESEDRTSPFSYVSVTPSIKE